MQVKRALIAAGAVLAAISTAAPAESTKQPDASAATSEAGRNQEGQGRTAGETPNQSQTQPQPQGPTGPINTSSGGAPASSPQGETPPGMQALPEGSSAQGAERDPGGR
jgi:hypothetical protein